MVVHGGGREIDAALAQASIPKHQVDGLRITDEATLQVVVAVLAGIDQHALVAAINAAGGRAVGLTGADAGRRAGEAGARRISATNGELVDLGLVGEPIASAGAAADRDARARRASCRSSPASAPSRDGRLFNVNADTLAGSLAARLRADAAGHRRRHARACSARRARRSPSSNGEGIDALVSSGTATAGMVAKLRACRKAVEGGVRDVVIADGREPRTAGARCVTGKARSRQGRVDADRRMTMTTSISNSVKALEAEHVLQTYKRAPVVFVRGEGTRLFDADGRRYLDFISGIGVVVLGHGHPGSRRSSRIRRRR